MDITGEYRIGAKRERVWEALNDPRMLQKCIPGCESIEKKSDTAMQARITAAIGPVKARFDTHLKLEDLDPPQRYALTGEAKAGATGFGRGRADVELAEDGAETLLRYRADFKVGGKLAQVGSRLVVGATRKTADEFFNNLSRELQGGETSKDDFGTSKKADSPKIWVRVAVVAGVLLMLWFLLG
ncbi:MAG: carbon monoxide dehydrogenase subunit G [Woeseia sp.]|nr:carbon monoxide dehydrogenase subunit G [Woeseia sp.]NNE60523.1 carbon monoxide dehydrogenase subunit G [Woeseia sp.]